ncbi:MAG: peptide chain release factor N(5)-glutamine methyltransferase [Phycisphaerae bacterium]
MTDRATASTDTWTLRRLLTWTRSYFQSNGLDEPRLTAELLLAHALGCRKIELYTRFDQTPSDDQLAAFRELVRTAVKGQPVAYLISRKEFYTLDFHVTPDVLIPRPETELIVERVLVWCDENPRERFDILDVGTGSGCIAVVIAARQPAAHVVATDCSIEALKVADQNSRQHEVGDRVRFVRADMLDLPDDAVPAGGFDIVVANPPYVAKNDPDALADNVRAFEPSTALFGGEDGLDAFRRIAGGIGRVLRSGGTLILEIGDGQADAVETILVGAQGLEPLERHRDLAGVERVVQFGFST